MVGAITHAVHINRGTLKHSISVASAPTGAIIVGHTRFNRVYAEEEEAGSRSKKKGQGKEEKGQEEKKCWYVLPP